MAPRRRIDPAAGRAAVGQWLAAQGEPTGGQGAAVDRGTLATAVRYALEELGARAPGRSVEVRVPPLGVVQCVEGSTHRRGTPPAVVETDAGTWLALVTGRTTWAAAEQAGALQASGQRTDLSGLLPLI